MLSSLPRRGGVLRFLPVLAGFIWQFLELPFIRPFLQYDHFQQQFFVFSKYQTGKTFNKHRESALEERN